MGLILSDLGKYLIRVRVGGDVEVDDQPHGAAVGVQRIHVVHVVNTAHLHLDGSGYRLFDGFGIGTDVRGVNLNLRGYNFRELRNG